MKAIASSSKVRSKKNPAFNAQVFLDSAGLARKVVEYQKSEKIYCQGESIKDVLYIQKGEIKLSVVNEVGKEAVVAMLGPGDFFGEGGLAGQLVRMGTATAITPTTLLVIEKQEMIRVLHGEHLRSRTCTMSSRVNANENRYPASTRVGRRPGNSSVG